jgi:hypothetical protein
MSTLLEAEKQKYEDMWTIDSYANYSPGEKFVPLFLDMAKTTMKGTVLDAGCGSGKGALALEKEGFKVQCCDFTVAGLVPEARKFPFTEVCLWNDLHRLGFVDWVYCCDVLEHIPLPFTMLVVTRLLAIARRGLFLSISFEPEAFGVWVGHRLHQSLQSYQDWRDQLSMVGELVEARDLLNAGVFLVKSR